MTDEAFVEEQEEYGNAAALTGRPRQRSSNPEPDVADDVDHVSSGEESAKAIPANCLRVLNTPLPLEHHGCRAMPCAGLSREGVCLAAIVRKANEQGIDWRFDLERDGEIWWWVYVGPPVDMADREPPPPARETYVCPHCHATNELDPGNFHFWCGSCGKNANDRV